MKICKRKSNCFDCRAFNGLSSCNLKFKVDYYEMSQPTLFLIYYPAEPCPKPKTYKEYFEYLKEIEQSKRK
jgi:hypothetical protein